MPTPPTQVCLSQRSKHEITRITDIADTRAAASKSQSNTIAHLKRIMGMRALAHDQFARALARIPKKRKTWDVKERLMWAHVVVLDWAVDHFWSFAPEPMRSVLMPILTDTSHEIPNLMAAAILEAVMDHVGDVVEWPEHYWQRMAMLARLIQGARKNEVSAESETADNVIQLFASK